MPNEIGVVKNLKKQCKVIQRSVSRRREHVFFRRIKKGISFERGRFCVFDFVFRVGENAILANTAHSDV